MLLMIAGYDSFAADVRKPDGTYQLVHGRQDMLVAE